MIRVTIMSGKYYGVEIGSEISREEKENIETLVNEGNTVIIVNKLYDLHSLKINPDDVKMVD